MLILCAVMLSSWYSLVDKSGVAGIVHASTLGHVLSVFVYHEVFLCRRLADALASWKSSS